MSFRTCFGIDFLTKVLLFLYSLSVFPAEIRCSSYCSHLSRIRRNRLSYESFIIFVFAFGISCGNTLFELLLSPFTNTSELTFLRKFHYFCIRFRYFLRKYVVRAIALTFREYVGIDFLTKVNSLDQHVLTIYTPA